MVPYYTMVFLSLTPMELGQDSLDWGRDILYQHKYKCLNK